jgi:hypothetical protein
LLVLAASAAFQVVRGEGMHQKLVEVVDIARRSALCREKGWALFEETNWWYISGSV